MISSTEGGRTCLGYHACREFALDNTDFDYDGVSGNIDLLANGDPGEAGFTGSTVIAEFASLSEAQAWADADPYVAAGVYAKVTIKPFKKVF